METVLKSFKTLTMTIERKTSWFGIKSTHTIIPTNAKWCVYYMDKHLKVGYKTQTTILSPDSVSVETSIVTPPDLPLLTRLLYNLCKNPPLRNRLVSKEDINKVNISRSILPGIKEQIVWRPSAIETNHLV